MNTKRNFKKMVHLIDDLQSTSTFLLRRPLKISHWLASFDTKSLYAKCQISKRKGLFKSIMCLRFSNVVRCMTEIPSLLIYVQHPVPGHISITNSSSPSCCNDNDIIIKLHSWTNELSPQRLHHNNYYECLKKTILFIFIMV